MNKNISYSFLVTWLFLLMAIHSAKAQKDGLDYFDLHLQKGIEFMEVGPNQDFFAALKEFELAKEYIVSDTSYQHEVIRDYNNRTSDSIRKLVDDLQIAEASARRSLLSAREAQNEATNANEAAQINLELANKIISAFYFYDNRFALAFKNNKYGFIDTKGNVLIKYNYEDARQFDNTGLARVRKNNQNYFVDTTGREYLLADRIELLNENVLALDLSNRMLQSVPQQVNGFDKLNILILDDNSIRILPPALSNLQNLTKLFLSGNNLEKVPLQIGKLSKLDLIDISQNQLIEIPSSIGNLSNLLELSLFDNNIEKLPHEFAELTSLQILDLGNNLLKKLPPNFNKLQELEVLVLEDNLFNRVPDEIYQLNNLQKLDLGANRLKKADGLYTLHKLTHLHIWKNRLDKFPDRINELVELNELVISYNRIEGNLAGLDGLKKLKVLDIGNNQLFSLEGISELYSLEALYADSVFGKTKNPIIPVGISYLKNLQTLDISHNRLIDLPSQMDSLDKLGKLLLTGNNFSKLPGVIRNLDALEVIDLQENNFNVLASVNDLTTKKYVIISYGNQNLEYLVNDSVLLVMADNFKLPAEPQTTDKQIILDLTGITDLELKGLTTIYDGVITFPLNEMPALGKESQIVVYLDKNLTSLNLSGNNFSDEEINSILTRFPNIQLIDDEN